MKIKAIFFSCIFTLLFIFAWPVEAAGLQFSTGFESPVSVGAWQGVGSNAYKVISGNDEGYPVFDGMPGGGTPSNLFTVNSQELIDNYHEIDIQTVGSTKALHFKNIINDYPNRSSATITPTVDEPWTEYYQEWKVRYASDYISRVASQATWNSQHTIWHNGIQTLVVQLIGNGSNVYTRLSLHTSNINYGDVNAVVGSKSGISGSYFYINQTMVPLKGNTWYTFGFYYKAGNGSGGEARFFIDGITVLHITGDTAVSTLRPQNINFIKLYGGGSATWPQEMWIDDLKVYDRLPEPTVTIPGDLPADGIIDNTDPGTTHTGTWQVSGASGYYGSDSVFSDVAGDTFTWQAALPATGPYDIDMRWTTWPSRYNAVPVKIYDGNNQVWSGTVDQSVNGGQWNRLAQNLSFPNKTLKITVTAAGTINDSTNADAVRITPASGQNIPGDLNQDSRVDVIDLGILLPGAGMGGTGVGVVDDAVSGQWRDRAGIGHALIVLASVAGLAGAAAAGAAVRATFFTGTGGGAGGIT